MEHSDTIKTMDIDEPMYNSDDSPIGKLLVYHFLHGLFGGCIDTEYAQLLATVDQSQTHRI
jgi:hypothetical protein